MPQHPPHHCSCRRRFVVAQEQGRHTQRFHGPAGGVSFMLASDFLGSDVPWRDVERGQVGTVYTLCLCHNRGTMSLETPNLIKDLQANPPEPCPQRRHYLLRLLVQTPLKR